MTRAARFLSRLLRLALSATVLGVCLFGAWPAAAQTGDPIAYVGHGAFFDHDGNQIPLSLSFVEKAQEWYRRELLSSLPESQKQEFAAFEKELTTGVAVHSQPSLVARQRALAWLLARSPDRKNDHQLRSKLNALQSALTRPLPD